MDVTPSHGYIIRRAKLRVDSSIDVTPSVLIRTRSKARIASSPVNKQDNVLSLLYIAIDRTNSGTDEKSPHHIVKGYLSVKKCKLREHELDSWF